MKAVYSVVIKARSEALFLSSIYGIRRKLNVAMLISRLPACSLFTLTYSSLTCIDHESAIRRLYKAPHKE